MDIHFVMQGKGGVGKSLIASLLAQYMMKTKTKFSAYDVDPVNNSFAQWRELGVEIIDLLDATGRINEAGFDQLMEKLAHGTKTSIVDVGASSMLPISTYLIENGCFQLLADHGFRVLIHVPITQSNITHTMTGFMAICDQMPVTVKTIVWLNEYFGGPVNDGNFEGISTYQERIHRVLGVVRLAELSPLFRKDLGQVLMARQTFADASQDPNIFLMNKQRLFQVWRNITNQIDTVFGTVS